MRLAGEILLAAAIALAVAVNGLHYVIVQALIREGGQADPVQMARAMEWPGQALLLVIPVALAGLAVIVAGWVTNARGDQ